MTGITPTKATKIRSGTMGSTVGHNLQVNEQTGKEEREDYIVADLGWRDSHPVLGATLTTTVSGFITPAGSAQASGHAPSIAIPT